MPAATGTAETFPNVPSTSTTGCALAATSRHVLVASGATAEIYDAATLALVAAVPLVVARTSGSATALPNGQILLAGGADTATLELFTPGN